MFKIFKMKPQTPADVKIEQLIKLMFPPMELHKDKEGTKFHVDYSVDANLEAVLHDLEDGYNDETARKTIRNIADRLYEVRQLLNAYQEIDSEARYFIVDDLDEDVHEKIQAKD